MAINGLIDPLDTQFDLNLFSLTRSVISQNKSRDLFLPIVVAVTENK